MYIEKTKICRPDRRVGFYTLNYVIGIDKINDMVAYALKEGFIEQGGAWYTVNDVQAIKTTGEIRPKLKEDGTVLKFQGRANLVKFFKENTEAYQEMNDFILNKMIEVKQ